jgi:hypothetical protein
VGWDVRETKSVSVRARGVKELIDPDRQGECAAVATRLFVCD